VKDEWFITLWLNKPGEVCLLDAGIDVWVAVILKHPEESIKSHVNAGGLNHSGIKRLNAYPLGVDFSEQVAIR